MNFSTVDNGHLASLESQSQIEVELKMAQAWRQKGKAERSIAGCEKVLAINPAHKAALDVIEALFLERGELAKAIALYRQVMPYRLNDAEFHKRHIQLVAAESNLEAAFAYYELNRKDEKRIEIDSSDLLCCVVVRNESVRLPYFLSYYRQKGVTKFLIIDNDSTDATLDYLLKQPDVYTWHSTKSFRKVNFGSVWFELLLRKYGVGHWCLTVDADELLYYPGCEHKTLTQLCQELDQRNYRAYTAILLDMYSDKAIQGTHYHSGQSFLEVCPYFDRTFYHRKHKNATPYQNQTIYVGGARERVFGKDGDYYLTKVPLLKYVEECVLAPGQHWTNYPIHQIALETGCLLHFKYFDIFLNYVQQEIVRKQHYGDAMQYSQYAKAIVTNPALTLYDARHSVKFSSAEQLVQLGIMRTEQPDESLVVEFPRIAAVLDDRPRPFWSTMITCHRPTYLEQALNSVLIQAADPAQMQIEVVIDRVAASTQAEIIAIAQRVGGDRIGIYVCPEKIGQPFIFNVAVERARGHWLHILHDDDWVEPGFYQALQQGVETESTIGAAFCRHRGVNNGQQSWVSSIERETSGVLDNWLERMVVFNRLQFSAKVVKRQVYETIGGFCPQADTVGDWEMWKRIAVHYPVWFEPQVLMNYREHLESASSTIIPSGKQIADIRKTIDISRRYLPLLQCDSLSRTALENSALYAISLAKQQLQRQNYGSVVVNLQEALKCSQTEAVQQAVARFFLEPENES